MKITNVYKNMTRTSFEVGVIVNGETDILLHRDVVNSDTTFFQVGIFCRKATIAYQAIKNGNFSGKINGLSFEVTGDDLNIAPAPQKINYDEFVIV